MAVAPSAVRAAWLLATLLLGNPNAVSYVAGDLTTDPTDTTTSDSGGGSDSDIDSDSNGAHPCLAECSALDPVGMALEATDPTPQMLADACDAIRSAEAQECLMSCPPAVLDDNLWIELYVCGDSGGGSDSASELDWANDVDDVLDRFDVVLDTNNTCFHPERPCELYENRAVNQSDTPTCQCPPGTGKVRKWNILLSGTIDTKDTRHECVRAGRNSGLVTSCEATYTYEEAYTTPDTTAPTSTPAAATPTEGRNADGGYAATPTEGQNADGGYAATPTERGGGSLTG